MFRIAVSSVMLAASALIALPPAYGQPVQYQFTPPPPIVALPSGSSGSLQTPGVAPPVPAPGPSAGPYGYAPSHTVAPLRSGTTRYVHTRHGRMVAVPGAAHSGQDSMSDRVIRCNQAGIAAGLGSKTGGFIGQCVN
jgi:hypothetical protein